MSDLKDAGFSVQEQVRQTDFADLLHRGRRRRTRNQLLLATGATATAAVAAAAIILAPNAVLNNGAPDRPPIATQPTTSAKARTAVPAASRGVLTGLVMTSESRWGSAWQKCTDATCSYGLTLYRDGASLEGTAKKLPQLVLPYTDPASSDSVPETIGLALPPTPPESPSDPAWKEAELYRLTPEGTKQYPVRYTGETTSFGSRDLVTDQLIGGEISVLDVEKGELKRLKLPADVGTSGSSVTRDRTGRTWIVAHQDGGSTAVAWTDDGKAWQQHTLDLGTGIETAGAELAVSADGKTVVVLPYSDGTTPGALHTGSMSTDSGKTWRTIDPGIWGIADTELIMVEGGVLLLGQLDADKPATMGAYKLKPDGSVEKQGRFPKLLTLGSPGGALFYGQTGPTTASVSTDAGRTWTNLPMK